MREALAHVDPSVRAPDANKPPAVIAGPPRDQRDEAIRGMVEGLAKRLRQDSSDVEGWIRLLRSYVVLGESEKARAAITNARRALATEPDKLRRFNEAAKILGMDG